MFNCVKGPRCWYSLEKEFLHVQFCIIFFLNLVLEQEIQKLSVEINMILEHSIFLVNISKVSCSMHMTNMCLYSCMFRNKEIAAQQRDGSGYRKVLIIRN